MRIDHRQVQVVLVKPQEGLAYAAQLQELAELQITGKLDIVGTLAKRHSLKPQP